MTPLQVLKYGQCESTQNIGPRRQWDRAFRGEPVPGPDIGTVHGDDDARPADGEPFSSTTAAHEEK